MDNLIDTECLPPLVQELIEVMGSAEAIKLLEARGGLPTYVPEHPERAGVLSQIVGNVALRALCGRFGRETIDLPKMDGITQQLRNRQIINAKGSGVRVRFGPSAWALISSCETNLAAGEGV